jgi:hypothetical protein
MVVTPSAMPTLASVSAGASLTPSPTMATRPPCSIRPRTHRSLSSGSSSARMSSTLQGGRQSHVARGRRSTPRGSRRRARAARSAIVIESSIVIFRSRRVLERFPEDRSAADERGGEADDADAGERFPQAEPDGASRDPTRATRARSRRPSAASVSRSSAEASTDGVTALPQIGPDNRAECTRSTGAAVASASRLASGRDNRPTSARESASTVRGAARTRAPGPTATPGARVRSP